MEKIRTNGKDARKTKEHLNLQRKELFFGEN